MMAQQYIQLSSWFVGIVGCDVFVYTAGINMKRKEKKI